MPKEVPDVEAVELVAVEDVAEVATDAAALVVEVMETQAACALTARSKEVRMLGVCILLCFVWLLGIM